ncbi:MAG TPA: hypothetical protein VFO16_22120 [Pseudonocardiaceae bacterium]|nr:hypothetical protein [Pseudonocardiaceae bacterium]
MDSGAVRKLMRTAASAALVLGLATGVAGLAAAPAMAQPSGQGGTFEDPGNGSQPGSGNNGSAPGSGSPTDAVTGLLGGVTGGGGKTP